MSGVARKCQVYPPAFCRAVCEGTAAQKRLHVLGMRSEPLMSMEEMISMVPKDAHHSKDPSRDLHEEDAEALPEGTVAWDDQSGAWLQPELMAKARREEIAYFKAMNVYRKVPLTKCWEVTGKDPIAVRWVDINKGDTNHPDYRSRLVAKEFRVDVRPDLYAATPPSECLRLLISKLASNPDQQLMHADVSRAYFYAKAVRPVYVQLPAEDFEEGDDTNCGELIMSMYGTRDAAVNWSAEYTATLLESGFVQGPHSPCLFRHPVTEVAIMVHGDDFVAVGKSKALLEARKTLDKYKLKVKVLGDGSDCVNEVRILNKVIRRTEEGIELEADPRHAEIVVKELGMTDANPSKVPGMKVRAADEDEDNGTGPCDEELDPDEARQYRAIAGDEELDPDEARQYRAIAARFNYLAVDRMDIQFAVKEAARAMSSPKQSHWAMLHKIGGYSVGVPRLVIKFQWQPTPTLVTAFTDSDWAGCIRTARSTSGGIVMIGAHTIKSYSRQQKVVALSSAEAELYAMVAVSAESFAVIGYAQDLGMTLEGEVYTDSSAALGITHRAGIGKVRHLRTQGLWVQEVHVSG